MEDNIIIGDSGYPIRPFLLTKLAVASTRGEHSYLHNESLIRIRNCIELSFVVLKRI